MRRWRTSRWRNDRNSLQTELQDSKDGKYTVTYTPQCVGQLSVEIQVNGQPLTGCPFLVQIRQHQYQFAFKFGSEEERQAEFYWILDIAASDKTGMIAVADASYKRIQLYSENGKFQTHVNFDVMPSSLGFTNCGDLLVLASENNKKLWLFSEQGHFIKHINDKHLNEPEDLYIASDGRLIILEEVNKKVKVLSPDGNDWLLSLTAPNCDDYPHCVVYHQNKFYVSYPGDHCMKVFDKTGVYLHDIGCKGSNDGQFDCPFGLVIDKYNRLIVCDKKNQRLQLFTLSGKFLSKLQGEYFNNNPPYYAALNNNGNLFVADSLGNCIFVFS